MQFSMNEYVRLLSKRIVTADSEDLRLISEKSKGLLTVFGER
jgi:hypothetical protein